MSEATVNNLGLTSEDVDYIVWAVATAHKELNDELKRAEDPEWASRLQLRFKQLLPKLTALRQRLDPAVAPGHANGWNGKRARVGPPSGE